MKKNLLSIIAIVLAVSLSAFSVQRNHSKKVFTNYFAFDGSLESQYDEPAHWSFVGTTPPNICSGNTIVCVVTASQTNDTDFRNAISSAQPQNENDLLSMSGVSLYSRQP
jgi:hypothetical protein